MPNFNQKGPLGTGPVGRGKGGCEAAYKNLQSPLSSTPRGEPPRKGYNMNKAYGKGMDPHDNAEHNNHHEEHEEHVCCGGNGHGHQHGRGKGHGGCCGGGHHHQHPHRPPSPHELSLDEEIELIEANIAFLNERLTLLKDKKSGNE